MSFDVLWKVLSLLELIFFWSFSICFYLCFFDTLRYIETDINLIFIFIFNVPKINHLTSGGTFQRMFIISYLDEEILVSDESCS